MNKVLKWVLIVLGSLVGIALLTLPFMFHGFRTVGPGMMGGRAGGFYQPYGGMMFGMGILMLFRLIVPLGVLTLAVVGVVALVRSHKSAVRPAAPTEPLMPQTPAAPMKVCAKCAKPVESDWKICPYCGKKQ